MDILKYFSVEKWRQFLIRSNVVVDRKIKTLEYERLGVLKDVELFKMDLDANEYEVFLKKVLPYWETICLDRYFKKFIEFYISYIFLDPKKEDVFLDAAGGIDTYAANLPCKKKYLTDLIISERLKEKYGDQLDYVEGSASAIPLPNESVDRISCHHSFEHFQENSDMGFIDEVQRLLASKGKCCIVPIFISNASFEISNRDKPLMPFDKKAIKIIDSTSFFTGGVSCGDFARVYSLDNFQKRIIDRIDKSTYKVSLGEITMDGAAIPDMKRKCHRLVARINCPYRVLFIEKIN